ncbi:U3 small nucleolar RNA-associated protein [Taphrina deformans PYCC 5710]|uniref:U three protein 7 n=1 Tax=Taphrina deformans (strain PYCC 5710 / ATCC 11124 / CBS 356.35 / IMI 108563 / JCM 9778 / NBRC 8474) TaxID=1097556 RepID=R4X939_TAPDE|nr:U3 small nucleolar RNA-associated protein [Taphrina deformans PYCC 5710]|eukprot:CCG80677.1 U3 small nucleolar RNA-associated protein [Taphrina deformans PYCC 5710]
MATDVLKYKRGDKKTFKTKDRKLNAAFKKNEKSIEIAQEEAAAAEILNTQERGFLEAEGLEKTYKFRQDALKRAVDVSTAQKAFELSLDFGSYTCDFTRNGRYLLLGGRKGHITSLDWKSGRLACEFHVNETIKDVKYLHNESLYAVAQKKYVYVYDGSGLEIHCLKNHVEVNALEFLPYHYLLATIGNTGYLKYQDISTGNIVSEHRSKLGPCSVLRQNPYNAILHTGHSNGVVNLWTPNMSEPAVKMLCHRGPIRDVAVDREGRYMVTAGQDSRLKVWDVRTYKELHNYFSPTPASSLSISDSGLVGVSWGSHVSIWKDAMTQKQESPYMTHLQPSSPITNIRFAPYEDFLGVAHEKGYTSLIVPGAGEANFDAFEANPYMSKQQRRTTEIRGLLEKLQPNMIALTPFIGDVDPASSAVRKQEAVEEKAARPEDEFVPRNRQRGRNSALRRVLRKKNKNVIDDRRVKVESLLRKEKEMKADRVAQEQGRAVEDRHQGPTLSRFAVHSKRR